MIESIHDRLDREAVRLKSDQADSVTRVSESFINGVEHAANIAHRMHGADAALLGEARSEALRLRAVIEKEAIPMLSAAGYDESVRIMREALKVEEKN